MKTILWLLKIGWYKKHSYTEIVYPGFPVRVTVWINMHTNEIKEIKKQLDI